MTTRLHTLPAQDATGQAAELFGAIRKAVGKVPNAYATIGSNSPAVLAQALQTNRVLQQGSLSAKELEAINLAISEHSGCDYCLAAHTLTATKLAGGTQKNRHVSCVAAVIPRMLRQMHWFALSLNLLVHVAQSQTPV